MATAGAQGETMSDEIYDYVCTPCKRKNKVRKADRYCSECASQLCSVCLNHHNDIHEDHELFAPSDVADFQVESTAFERCEKHPKLTIERFCVSCNELLCHTCALNHRLSRLNLGTYHLDGRIESYLGSINTVGCFKPTYSVKNMVSYNFQMSGEDECNIYYSCLLPDGRVLQSDYENNKLKCFSPSSNTVTETCYMPSYPLGVCCVSTQEVAVSLGNNTIQFVTFTPSLTLSRWFKVDHDCCGIAYRDDCLFITDWGTKVYIHNMDGSLNAFTVPGVSVTYDVALSPGGELLYVTCDTGLVCLERNGRLVYTRGVGGGECTGVCVDESGCVVVCDYGSDRVVEVGEYGEVLAELLGTSDGLRSPCSVCVDSINMKLYVTSNNNP